MIAGLGILIFIAILITWYKDATQMPDDYED